MEIESTAHALQRLAQPVKVGVAILITEKAGPAIVTTLYDAQRYTVDVDARTPGHESTLAEIERGPLFVPRERFGIDCQDHGNPDQDSLISTVMRLAA
ncbi:MAG: hypothetical protein LJE70_01500 [Chromatiaceae bacterium]|nr:hypothetical protein [Chromatiaceae bacterium]